MTKRQPCASKLRLSKLCRWLICLGIAKLALFGAWATDLHLPQAVSEHAANTAPTAVNMPVPAPEHPPHAESLPPALSVPAAPGTFAAPTPAAAVRSAAPLPSMPPIPYSRLRANPAENAESETGMLLSGGVDTGSPFRIVEKEEDGGWWSEIVKLTKLPVPMLGVLRTAHAAVMDAPPPPQRPAASGGPSPFAPPEQTQAQGRQAGPPRSDATAGIPPEAGLSRNAPLPLRPQGASPAPSAPQLRDTDPGARINAAPAPNVKPFISPDSPERKQQDLARREQEVLMLKQQMEARLQELQSTEKKVKGMLEEAHGVQDQKLKHLISSYTNMKAKQAAQALESLDERLAVKILAGMNPKQAGEVLTYTDPKVVAKLTELLARMQLPTE